MSMTVTVRLRLCELYVTVHIIQLHINVMASIQTWLQSSYQEIYIVNIVYCCVVYRLGLRVCYD